MSITDIQAIVLAVGGNGLGTVRGLSLEKIRTGIVVFGKEDVSLFSKYPVIKNVVSATTKESQENQILAFLRDYEDRGVVVIPTSDRTVTFLNDNRSYFERYFKTALPPMDLVDRLIDKAQEVEFIGKLMPIPKTLVRFPESSKDLLEELRLPIIVKPRSHKLSLLGKKNIVLWTKDDVVEFYDNKKEIFYSLIAQEIIPGFDTNLWVCDCTYNRAHELNTAFVFRRLRTAPAHYGVTSCAVSEWNSQIIKYAEIFGKAASYIGPAMLEFKFDERDQEYKYIEMNPRLGMCNIFDTSCGVNNVYAAFNVASGGTNKRKESVQRDGVLFLDIFDDIYARKHDGEKLGHLVNEYIRILFRKHVSLYFYWKDPLPLLIVVLQQAAGFFIYKWNNIRLKFKRS